MNSVQRLLLLPALPLLLVACGGGHRSASEAGAFCDSISGGSAQLTTNCVGCTINRPMAAADNSLSTAADAIAMAGVSNATATIRATAQSGIVFPAGSNAGVFYTPYSNVCSNCAVTINTYLNGTLQESRSGVSNATGSGSPAALYSGVTALLQFNAVEIVTNGTIASVAGGLISQTYEICSNGGFR